MGIDPASYVVFFLAALVMCVAPGPDMIYILTHGISQGTRAGLLSALGMSAGMACHTVAVALGVSAIIGSSQLAYEVLRYAGAGYLLYMAFQALRDSSQAGLTDGHRTVPLSTVFRNAALTNLLNPKVVLFYLAFLPQFVSSSADRPGLALLVLGLLFTLLGLAVDSLIALLSGQLGAHLRRRPRSGSWLNRLAGVVFIGLAAKLALS